MRLCGICPTVSDLTYLVKGLSFPSMLSQIPDTNYLFQEFQDGDGKR